MIRCCLCRDKAARGTAIGVVHPNGQREHVNFEPTHLPGSGYRCIDRDACKARVREIVQAHIDFGEVCAIAQVEI